ncbi:MAG: type IV secretory system conjugative DNA transfer family protein, partial [Rubrobacter sp.]
PSSPPSTRENREGAGRALHVPDMSTESAPDLGWFSAAAGDREKTILASPTGEGRQPRPGALECLGDLVEGPADRANLIPAFLAPALALDLGDETLLYRTGRRVAEHWEEISTFLSDPVDIATLAVLLVASALALALALKLALKALRAAWDALHAGPGRITLGFKRGEPLHYLTDPPLRIAFEDARKGGLVLVGPTGQGKTTALLLILVQALLRGHTVVVLEADGNLGLRLLKYARAMGLGKRCFHFDPSVRDSWKWNPLSGDPERAVRRAVNTVVSVSHNHPFYGGLNENVMRQMTKLTISYAAHAGVEPTLALLLRLLTDHGFLDELLDFGPNATGVPEIRAPFVDGDLKVWLEQEYLSWSPKVRGEYLLGLRNFLRSFLSSERVAQMLSPEAEEERKIDVGRVLESGGLLVFRCTSDEVGEVESQTILSLAQQTIQQETLGRGAPMRPLWSTIDEAHIILGSHNTATAQSYSRWFVQSRKFGVVPVLGYQSFFQLPDSLRKVIAGSARNKLIFGGLHGEDARHAQELLGHTTRRKTETRQASTGGLFAPKSTQEVTTLVEGPYYSLPEVESLPVGYCFFKGVRGKRQPPPTVVKLGKLPSFRRLRGRAPGAPKGRPKRKRGGR